MKKNYILLACSLFLGTFIKAQDTLLFENFETTAFYTNLDSVDLLPGFTADSLWYSCDMDMIPDGSGSNRANGWFPVRPFAKIDEYQTGYQDSNGNPDTNTAIGANSWNNNGDGSAGLESNWLVTPSVTLGTHDTLFWKSAPSQTPRYLDGYEVLLSTTTNEDVQFTHVLFTAAEMTGTPTAGDTIFSNFTFAPAGAFVHGQDGTYIQTPASSTDPAKPSYSGQLRPFSVPLDTYANQIVYIAFHHNSHDDNLISLDDVMIRGTLNPNIGIKEQSNNLDLNIFPNPAGENAQLNFELTAETNIIITVYDVTGQMVYSQNEGNLTHGRHFANINTSTLSKGFYSVTVKSNNGFSAVKMIVK